MKFPAWQMILISYRRDYAALFRVQRSNSWK